MRKKFVLSEAKLHDFVDWPSVVTNVKYLLLTKVSILFDHRYFCSMLVVIVPRWSQWSSDAIPQIIHTHRKKVGKRFTFKTAVERELYKKLIVALVWLQ